MTTINMLGVALSGTIGPGTTFSGGLSAIGTWTPVFIFATLGDLSVSYATQIGTYNSIGNIYNIVFDLSFTPTFTTASGNVSITGLPKTAHSGGGVQFNIGRATLSTTDGWTTGYTDIIANVSGSSTSVGIVRFGSGHNQANMNATNFVSGTAVTISGSVSYLT